MAGSKELRREHPSTYFVQDRSNQEELKRLHIQDQMMTADMGGVLVEQPEPIGFRRILDVGCGTGGWLIEIAEKYPAIPLLVGIDVSGTMVEYARSQAKAQKVSDRVEFHVMDALRMLEFPANHFDLVNQRMGQGYLRTWDWPKILEECQRVVRPGGVVRITESDITESNSSAQMRLAEIGLEVFYRSGHFFTRDFSGVTSEMAHLLSKHARLQDIQTRAYTVQYRAGTPEWQGFYENTTYFLRTVTPFLRRWTRLPEDYGMLCQQVLSEMQQPDFVATSKLLTAWGTKPK